MHTATISSQGQIAIPKKLRESLSIYPGSRIAFIPQSYSIAIVPQKKGWIKKARGILQTEIAQRGGVKKTHERFEKDWNEKNSSHPEI